MTEQSAPSFKLSGWLSIRINTGDFATSIYIPANIVGYRDDAQNRPYQTGYLKTPAAKKSVYEIETELDASIMNYPSTAEISKSFIVVSNGGTGRTAGAREQKDIIISNSPESARGSPRPARAGGNLVGRGIANPMSERTRGFEMGID